MGGRVYYLGLQLLDRQLVDRSGRLVGKVDDLELERGESGDLYVSAVLAGPGVLARRMGLPWGDWVQEVHRRMGPRSLSDDPARIPFAFVSSIGNHIDVAAEQQQLATQSLHEWVTQHVIGHIPGGRHAPE